jgi:hypothetical protein
MIHEHGIILSRDEKKRLSSNAMSQDRQIVMIYMRRPGEGYTFYDIVQATGFNQDSVKRSISNMAGSGNLEKYKDKYGRFPLVKTEGKRLNPDTGVQISIYEWNHRYNQVPSYKELYEKHQREGQMKFWEV